MLGLAVGLALPLRHSESVYNHNRNKSNYYSGLPMWFSMHSGCGGARLDATTNAIGEGRFIASEMLHCLYNGGERFCSILLSSFEVERKIEKIIFEQK